VFPRSVILIGQELIKFLCVVLIFLNKMYVQSMHIKCITNLILDLARKLHYKDGAIGSHTLKCVLLSGTFWLHCRPEVDIL
jgi:hypothetical protein